MQLEIDCIEWALKKIEVNRLPIKKRLDTDDFWILNEFDKNAQVTKEDVFEILKPIKPKKTSQ